MCVCVCVFIQTHITAHSGPAILLNSHSMPLALILPRVCVCVVIPFILDVRFVDVPARITQEEGHTGFLHLSSAVHAIIFIEGFSRSFPSSTVNSNFVLCVFSSHSFWTSSSLDVPAGVTQNEGHTGFLIHLFSAVRALLFFARRIQPFLSLVDREVEFCVLTISSFSTRWAF